MHAALLLAFAAVLLVGVLWALHSRQHREHFANPIGVFDLAEFSSLPSGVRDLLRAQLNTLVGGLTVKLSDLYAANPDYMKTSLEALTQAGLATILTYNVPVPPPPAPPPAPGTTVGPVTMERHAVPAVPDAPAHAVPEPFVSF